MDSGRYIAPGVHLVYVKINIDNGERIHSLNVMNAKVDNKGMCSIGKFFPHKTKATFNEEDFRLDYFETKLWKHLKGESIEVIGFWVPTGDYNYVRAILNTEEVPADVVPFMWMQVFLDKLDKGVIQEWNAFYVELLRKEAEERDAREAEYKKKQEELYRFNN